MAGISLWKANKAVKGAMLNVSFSSNTKDDKGNLDQKFWFSITKQVGWQNDHGVFKDGERLNVSLNGFEVCGVLNTLKEYKKMREGNFSFYHSTDKGNSSGSLYYFYIKAEKEGDKDRDGFIFNINKDKKSEAKVGLTVDEGLYLAHYLEFGLTHCFDAIYSKDKKDALERAAKTAGPKDDNEGAGDENPPASKKTTSAPKAAAPAPKKEVAPDENGDLEDLPF